MVKEITVFKEFIGDSPTTRLLEFLIEGRFFDYTLTELAEKAGISWRTLHRIFPNFIKAKVIKQTREIGRAKLYTLNTENPGVKKLIELFDRLLEDDMQYISKEIEKPVSVKA